MQDVHLGVPGALPCGKEGKKECRAEGRLKLGCRPEQHLSHLEGALEVQRPFNGVLGWTGFHPARRSVLYGAAMEVGVTCVTSPQLRPSAQGAPSGWAHKSPVKEGSWWHIPVSTTAPHALLISPLPHFQFFERRAVLQSAALQGSLSKALWDAAIPILCAPRRHENTLGREEETRAGDGEGEGIQPKWNEPSKDLTNPKLSLPVSTLFF